MHRSLAAVLLVACGGHAPVATTQAAAILTWTRLASGTTESLRGLSVVSRDVAWASGTNGTVLRTIDGATWSRCATPPGAEALDLRSLEALDAAHAVVISAGSPAHAFVTRDACASWTETYTRQGEGVFFDSLVLRDRAGLALGDPLPTADGSRFMLLASDDDGLTWQARAGPLAEAGEAAFAASNGCIAWPSADVVLFATGGLASRVFRSTNAGVSWSSARVPVPSSASAGVFAIAFRDPSVGYAIGGDYAAPTMPGSFASTADGGATWQLGASPRGYRSSIAIAFADLLVVGMTGSDVSHDDGASWIPFDDAALNTVRTFDRDAYAVGPNGTITRLTSR